MPHCISSLLTTPVLGSPGSEWLPCLAAFQAFSQPLSSALQEVSGCRASLCFKLLMTPVLGSPVGEWTPSLATVQACSRCLSSALQDVSGCRASLRFKPAYDSCPRFSSE